MNRGIRVLWLTAFVGLCAHAPAQTLDDYILAQMSQNNIPGLSACIIKRGSVVWTGHYGVANFAGNIPVSSNTIFMLASVAKTVTATALLQVYENGGYELDDSINAYLPFGVRNPSHPETPITFSMLLTHTSAIRDNWQVMPYVPGDPTTPLGQYLEDYLTPGGKYYDAALNFYAFAPGTGWAYSNIGIALCGYLVEAITGTPFDTFCSDSIFSALDMDNTAWFLRDLDTTLVARPYHFDGNGYVDYGLYGYADYPDGQLRTTVTSLARFLQANMQGGVYNGVRILDSSTVRMMRTPQIPLLDPTQGLVWSRITSSTGKTLWGHNGGDLGVTTEMFLCESDSTGVIVLTNGEGGVAQIRDMLFQVSDTITDVISHEFSLPTAFKLEQNYPNPFNPGTTIEFSLPPFIRRDKGGFVTLKIYNLLGQEVATLVNEEMKAGSYRVTWNASGFASGTYFYRLSAGMFVETKKLILLK